jgi:hypothetical protein
VLEHMASWWSSDWRSCGVQCGVRLLLPESTVEGGHGCGADLIHSVVHSLRQVPVRLHRLQGACSQSRHLVHVHLHAPSGIGFSGCTLDERTTCGSLARCAATAPGESGSRDQCLPTSTIAVVGCPEFQWELTARRRRYVPLLNRRAAAPVSASLTK